MTTKEKIPAGDVQVGDRISTQKKLDALRVVGITDGTNSRYITLDGGARIRPRRVTPVWRETEPLARLEVGSAGVRSAIEDAIEGGRDLWFLYEGGEERTHIRHARPERIYRAERPPFAEVMVAEDLDRDAPRSFRVDRMREAVVGTGTLR